MTHACVTVKLMIRNVCSEQELNGLSFKDVVMGLILKNGLCAIAEDEVRVIEIKPVLQEQVDREECL